MTRSSRAAENGSGARAESGEASPGRLLQALHEACFQGGGWVDPLTWDDYDAEGHALWEVYALVIARNIRVASAAPDLLGALILAEDVLSRFPFSSEIWPNGTHPNTGIERIRAAIQKATSPLATAGPEGGRVPQEDL